MKNDMETAITLVETGQTEKGLALMKELLTSTDDDTAYQIAVLFQDWGHMDDAENIYTDLLYRYPNDSGLLIQMAELFIDKDEEEKAIDYLINIFPQDDNYLSAQLLLADLYQMQGLDEVAERKLKGAYQAAPTEPIISLALGEFYLSTGQPAEAIPFYKDILHAETLAHENIQLKLAEALSLNGQFEEALIYYQKGLETEKTLDGLFGYGMTAFQTQKFQTAISALKELKTMDPQYSTLYPVLAQSYHEEGRQEEALATLEEGMKSDEHNERLYYQAGEIAAKLNHWSKAEYYYNELVNLDPDNLEAVKRLMEIKINTEAYDDVISYLDQGQFDDPTLRWYFAKATKLKDELSGAKGIYDELYLDFKENPEFLSEYGELMWQLGETKHALKVLKEATLFDPDNQELQAFVERIEQDFY